MDECLKRRNGFANNNSKMVFNRTKEDSSMDDDSLNSDSEATRLPSSLHTLMSSIMDERKRDYVSDEKDEFLFVQDHNVFWAHMFSKHFIDSPDDTHKDDLLFYVRKGSPESNGNDSQPHISVEVYRKWSTCKPLLTDAEIDFEETVYLNFILQHFEYYVTCAVCMKTSDSKPAKVLRKLTQRVYASPSRRKMDSKGTEEEITYPNIFFTIDNFEEAFADQIVQESEMICVELVAVDCMSSFQGALFRGSVSHEALKGVFEAKGSAGRRMPLSRWWFREPDRIEFIKMSGPNGKGCAEMAVSCAKSSVPEAQSTQVLTQADSLTENSEEFHGLSRRSSDPNFGWHRIFHGSLKRMGLKKSRSNMENLGASGMSVSYSEQANSSSIDESDETVDECRKDDLGKSLSNGGWHWWNDRKTPKSMKLNSFLTYVSLPWHRIIADICGECGRTEALFFSEDDRDHRDAV